jgi:hypothetical protein
MSSGGVLALDAAARGLAIKKLALYEPPFNSGDEHGRQASENYTSQLTALLTEGRRGDAVALAMTTWGAPAEAIAGMRQTPIWPLFEAVASTCQSAAETQPFGVKVTLISVCSLSG